MNATKLLAGIAVLQGALLVGLITRGGATPAYGQIPDAGAQRQAAVDEMKALNAKMDKLIGLLESGNLQVRVAPPDEKK